MIKKGIYNGRKRPGNGAFTLFFGCILLAAVISSIASFSSCREKRKQPSLEYFEGIFTHADTIYVKDRHRGLAFMDSVIALYPDPGPKVIYRKYAITRNYYFQIKSYDTAIMYSDSMLWEVMDRAMEEEFTIDYAGALFLKGDVLFEMENYSEAFEYYYEARKIVEKSTHDCDFSEINARLGMVCYRQERYKEAADYFTQTYFQRAQCNDSYWRFTMQQRELSNIGLSYYKAGYIDSALVYYRKTLDYIAWGDKKFPEKTIYSATAKAVVYGNLGTIYYEQGKMREAENLFKESIAINSQPAYNNEDAQITRVKLTRLYLAENRLPEAQAEMKRLERSLLEIPDRKTLLDLYKLQSDYYKRMKQPDQAFDALNSYLELKDSLTIKRKKLLGSDFDKEFEGMETRYQLEFFRKKHELQTTYLAAMLIFSIMTGIILFLVWKNWKRAKRSEVELKKAKKIAEQAASAKQDFLSHMSHEIRTPMNAVIGMTHLLLNDNPKQEQKENLQVLKFSSENLLTLINDILDYSKIEAGKITFEHIDFNLRELVTNLRMAHQLKAEEKGIRLRLDMDQNLPDLVIGDPVRLAQILNNLLSNAIKFTQEGSVRLDVKRMQDSGDGLKIYFAVIDTGIGIDMTANGDIFESFTQAASDTTRRFGGTGLGLAITQRLLQLQGSKIQLESTPGAGSTFSFTLHFQRSEKKQQDLDVVGGSVLGFHSLRGYKVLLVDDSDMNIMVATKFLERWNLEVDTAFNGIQAISKVQEKEYDLVLMDIQMPEMDGFEASTKIRSLPEPQFRHIPIIALSADIMPETQEKVKKAGMNDYISKPFNPHELYSKISGYLLRER